MTGKWQTYTELVKRVVRQSRFPRLRADEVDAESVSTERASITEVEGQGDIWRLVDRVVIDADADETDTIDFDGLTSGVDYKVRFNARPDTGSQDIILRINDDDEDNYEYFDEDGTKVENENGFLVYEIGTENDRISGEVYVVPNGLSGDSRIGFFNKPRGGSRGFDGYGLSGGYDQFVSLSKISIIDASGSDFQNEPSAFELWRRDR